MQAKENVAQTGEVWRKLWQAFEKQRWSQGFNDNDQLYFVTAAPHAKHRDLKEAAARAQGASDPQEWLQSLSNPMSEVVESVRNLLSEVHRDDTSLLVLFSCLEVELLTLRQMEQDEIVRWMPPSNIEPTTLFSLLRDSVGGWSRYRRVYKVTDLLDELVSKHQVTISEPSDYGTTVYLETIRRATARVEVLGTELSGSIESLFLWPTLREVNAAERRFEDVEEDPWQLDRRPKGLISLKKFPDALLDRAAVIAGAGFGKTALLGAICYELTKSNRIPAQILLSELAEIEGTVLSYLNRNVNERFNVRLPWEAYCDAGRAVVLFDGLDELTPSDRTRVAQRIRDFGDRFPNVAWLLTIRDHGALPSLLDAKVLTIDPLSGDQIAHFARAYARAGCSVAPEALIERIETRPDLNALMKVPLFLALLMTTSRGEEDLPDGRSGLLERYLNILLQPQDYRLAVTVSVPASQLRVTAELLAFTALEYGEMGLQRREVTQLLRDVPEAEKHIDGLVARGLLRKSTLRLNFSYPIVQEYLAACYLLSHAGDEELGQRYELAIRRPWAQTLQFVLEMHETPDDLVRSLLEREDDAFHTVSRLVGRCVVNGAHVSLDVRAAVGDRLAEAWAVQAWTLRKSLGDLIADGFTHPLPDRVRELVLQAWGMNDGTKRIVAACGDLALTKGILRVLLEGNFRYNYFLHEMQPAVDKLADEALRLYVERAKRGDVDQEDANHLAHLIAALDPEQLAPESYQLAAEDTTLPETIRLAGYMVAQGPLSDQGIAIAQRILYSAEEETGGYLATLAIERSADPTSWWHAFIQDDNAPEDKRRRTLFEFLDEANDGVKEKPLLRLLASDKAVPRNLRHTAKLLLAYSGEAAYLEGLGEVLGELDRENLILWCFVLCRYRSGESMVTRGLERLDALPLAADDTAYIAAVLATDMTRHYKMMRHGVFLYEGYVQHPNIKQASDLIWKWFERYDGDVKGRLRLLASATELQYPSAKERLAAEVAQLLEADSESFARGDGRSGSDSEAISTALHALEEVNATGFLSLEQLKRMTTIASHNPALGALRLIARHATSEALDTLLELYELKKNHHIADSIVEMLENMAGRLGVQLVRRDNSILRLIRR